MTQNSYTFTIGRFECMIINDGGYAGTASALFAGAPEQALAHALAQHGETPDKLPATCSCLLVQSESQLILIDTGVGFLYSMEGRLVATMREKGFAPDDVDIVVLTHIHGDHIGGCINHNGELTFSNARFVMGGDEWHYWTSQESLQDAPQWAADTAQQILPKLADRMRVIQGQNEIVRGIELIPAPGHTIGHVAVSISSDGDQLLYLSDTALHPIHLEYPDWTASVDQIPEQTIETRKQLFELAVREKALVTLFHFMPFPSLGYIRRLADRWQWEPAASP
ncbi:MAG: MBL fold metallo-hydrolase [Anaerolineae bacterium]|nr:MBL fold metallo-hydrolase [Anaerolineae bacterium]